MSCRAPHPIGRSSLGARSWRGGGSDLRPKGMCALSSHQRAQQTVGSAVCRWRRGVRDRSRNGGTGHRDSRSAATVYVRGAPRSLFDYGNPPDKSVPRLILANSDTAARQCARCARFGGGGSGPREVRHLPFRTVSGLVQQPARGRHGPRRNRTISRSGLQRAGFLCGLPRLPRS